MLCGLWRRPQPGNNRAVVQLLCPLQRRLSEHLGPIDVGAGPDELGHACVLAVGNGGEARGLAHVVGPIEISTSLDEPGEAGVPPVRGGRPREQRQGGLGGHVRRGEPGACAPRTCRWTE